MALHHIFVFQVAHICRFGCGCHGNADGYYITPDCLCVSVCACVCLSVCLSVFRQIHRVAAHLHSRDIAHNFFLTRGSAFNDTDSTQTDGGAGQQTMFNDIGDSDTDHGARQQTSSTVRAYLWPRKSVYGELRIFTYR